MLAHLREQSIKHVRSSASRMHDTIDLIAMIFAMTRLGAVLLPMDFALEPPLNVMR